jgi:hypothetical protein
VASEGAGTRSARTRQADDSDIFILKAAGSPPYQGASARDGWVSGDNNYEWRNSGKKYTAGALDLATIHNFEPLAKSRGTEKKLKQQGQSTLESQNRPRPKTSTIEPDHKLLSELRTLAEALSDYHIALRPAFDVIQGFWR